MAKISLLLNILFRNNFLRPYGFSQSAIFNAVDELKYQGACFPVLKLRWFNN